MSEDPSAWRRKPAGDIRVDVVIPVYNEAHVLERSIRRIHQFFEAQVPYQESSPFLVETLHGS